MLARGQGARPAIPLEPPKEGPSVEDLRIPDDVIESASTAELVRLVFKTQEARVTVAERFEDVFEHLVTGGRADEYAPLCDRFKPRLEAVNDNLERLAARMDKHPALMAMVQRVLQSEVKRIDLQLELQVLRQRLSVSAADGLVREREKSQVQSVQSQDEKLKGVIFETLEELRCEAADLEEDD